MNAYKILERKRRVKQFLTGIVFVAILILSWHYPLLGYFIPLCMLLGITIGLKKGRKWCDWCCPRGSFYDALIKSISPKREIPRFFKSLNFRIVLLCFLMIIMTINLVKRWPDFYKIGAFFVMLITITTVLGVILAIIFHPRTWCYFCPIGTIVNLIGRNKYPLKINSDLCVECKLCAGVCPIQIKPYLFKAEGIQIVKDGDCLKCRLCVMACPQKAISL